MMNKRIFYFEYKKLVAEKIFWLLSILLFLLTLFSIYNGSKWADLQKHTIHKISYGQKEKLTQQIADAEKYQSENTILDDNYPLSFPNVLNYTMKYFIKEPSPNAIFSIGQSDLYPYYIRYNSLSSYNMPMNREIKNPNNLLIGHFDFQFLLVYILPLFIIISSYNLFSSEKEQGTDILLKIYYPNIKKYIFYKMIFRYIWLSFVIIFSTLLGIILFSSFSISSFSFKEILTGVILILSYILFWFSLSYFINSFAKNSLYNGIILAILWLFIAFLVPTIMDTIANEKYPIYSRNEQTIKLRANNEQGKELIKDKYENFIKKNKSYIKIDKDTIINNHKILSWYPPMVFNIIDKENFITNLEEQNKKQLDFQYHFIDNISLFSPTLLLQKNLHTLSGNGYENFSEFESKFTQKHKEWQKYSFDKLFKGEPFEIKEIKKSGNIVIFKNKKTDIFPILLDGFILLTISIFLLVISLFIQKTNKPKQ